MLEHCVKHNQQLAHAGGQRDLRRFAVTAQPLIEGAEGGVVAAAGQGSHIEHIPYVCSATPDQTLAAPRTTIAVKRRYPDQGGNLSTIERAQFGQMGERAQAQHLVNAWQ